MLNTKWGIWVFKHCLFRLALSHKLKQEKKKNRWNVSRGFSAEPSTLHRLSRWAALKNNNEQTVGYIMFPPEFWNMRLWFYKNVSFEGSASTLHCLRKWKEFVSACVCVREMIVIFISTFLKKTTIFFFNEWRNVLLRLFKKLVEW